MNSQTIDQRPTFGFRFLGSAFSGGLSKPSKTAENAKNGHFRGISGVIPEQFRDDSGAFPGQFPVAANDLSAVMQAMKAADETQAATKNACGEQIKAILCHPETINSLRATILEVGGDYETYISGMESMLDHFDAGVMVRVTTLAERLATPEMGITKKFLMEKIKPILEQYGILVKKDDNTFRWARLDELQNLQKTGGKCDAERAAPNTERTACDTETTRPNTGSAADATGTSKQGTGTASYLVGGKDAGAAGGVLAQLSKNLPRITVRPEMLAGAGLGVAVGAGLYISWDAIAHALEILDAQLVAPAWYKPALSALGQASTIGLASSLYSLQWAIRTDIKRLSATIGYALLVAGASAPVLAVCGFDGGMVGQYVAGWLQAQGVAPAVVAASGTLLALFASMRSGNPLPKLAVLLDLAGGFVTGLLPEGKAEPVVPVQPAPVANPVGDDALKAKMREVLVARKLEYVDVQQVCVGPVLTTFMVKVPMDKDTKALNKETNKIATVFKASGEVAVIEHVRGTDCGAIEVPNAKRGTVSLSSLMQSPEWLAFAEPLPMLLGVDTFGNPKMLSLPNAIHLLVAGSTGMGKSMFMNAILLSMMARSTPDMLRLHMVDPKQLEFGLYEGSPFVQGEIITDMGKVRPMLEGLIDEMECRYGLMKAKKVRNIAQYNAKSDAPLPYEVALFEEFADFVMLDRLMGKMTKVRDEEGNEVVATQAEELIIRLAQKARAAGIHLLPTTQRPDKDVVTPLIRSNIPSRIAFKVMSDGDSNIILGKKGAENLLDKGDGYGLFPGSTELQRFHGPFVTEAEVEAAVAQQRRRWGK